MPRKPVRKGRKAGLDEARALLERQKAEQENTQAFINGYGALCRRHGLMIVPVPVAQQQGTIMIVSSQFQVVPLPPGQDVNLRLADSQSVRPPAFAPTPQPGPDLPSSEDAEQDADAELEELED